MYNQVLIIQHQRIFCAFTKWYCYLFFLRIIINNYTRPLLHLTTRVFVIPVVVIKLLLILISVALPYGHKKPFIPFTFFLLLSSSCLLYLFYLHLYRSRTTHNKIFISRSHLAPQASTCNLFKLLCSFKNISRCFWLLTAYCLQILIFSNAILKLPFYSSLLSYKQEVLLYVDKQVCQLKVLYMLFLPFYYYITILWLYPIFS